MGFKNRISGSRASVVGRGSAAAFILSVLVHGALLFVVGGLVIFKGIVPRTPFTLAEEAPIELSDVEVMEMPEETESSPEVPAVDSEMSPANGETGSQEPMDPSLMVSTGTNTLFSLPASNIPAPVVGHSLMPASKPGGKETGPDTSKAAMRTLFGSQVQARKLGVVVDSYASMSPFMNQVLPEIEAKFPEAVVFFLIGCGLKSDRSNAVPVKLDKDNVGSTYFGKQQFDPVNLNNPWIGQLIRRGRAYSLRDAVDKHSDTLVAFNTMIEQNVDVMYWFTDFTDDYEPRHVESMAQRLAGAGILVLMHHPAGTPDDFERSGYWRKFPNLAPYAKANMELLERHFLPHLPKGSGFIRQSLFK